MATADVSETHTWLQKMFRASGYATCRCVCAAPLLQICRPRALGRVISIDTHHARCSVHSNDARHR